MRPSPWVNKQYLLFIPSIRLPQWFSKRPGRDRLTVSRTRPHVTTIWTIYVTFKSTSEPDLCTEPVCFCLRVVITSGHTRSYSSPSRIANPPTTGPTAPPAAHVWVQSATVKPKVKGSARAHAEICSKFNNFGDVNVCFPWK